MDDKFVIMMLITAVSSDQGMVCDLQVFRCEGVCQTEMAACLAAYPYSCEGDKQAVQLTAKNCSAIFSNSSTSSISGNLSNYGSMTSNNGSLISNIRNSSTGLAVAIIVGIVVGCIVCFAFVIVLVVYYRRHGYAAQPLA